MHRFRIFSSTLVLSTLLLGATAHAESYRSGDRLPAPSSSVRAKSADSDGPRRGPKGGFPENHGTEQATEHANEHSALYHHDSPGG